ncbi:MAG: ferrous iron transport protein B [Pseudomonadota bacterium]
MDLALVGQPVSGKSTLFNAVVGYRAVPSNCPGSSVTFTRGTLDVDGEQLDLIDLPGLYSLLSDGEGDSVAVTMLEQLGDDAVVVNVVDASMLSRSLELTLQLCELGRPLVLCLNMMDEAQRKGQQIDAAALSGLLGVPVVQTTGRKGEGVRQLFEAALRAGRERRTPRTLEGPRDVEACLRGCVQLVGDRPIPQASPRLLALRWLERNPAAEAWLERELDDETRATLDTLRRELEDEHGQPAEIVVSAMRHDQAFALFEKVCRLRSPERDLRRLVDSVLLHPVLGYLFLAGILYGTFSLIFSIGNGLEPLFLNLFDGVRAWVRGSMGGTGLLYAVVDGAIAGVGGGIGIVVPYLLPFFLCLAFLEDSGYLPRIAMLVDNFMHRIGLHGLSVVPIVMGYGCTVPGILATRILKSPRDKLITATLTTLVPCSARMTVIFGLVGFFISMKAALLVYALNAVILVVTGKVMSILMPEVSPGMLLEIPRYHLPRPIELWRKTWFRLKEFVVIAWPLLIVGSIVLEGINHLGLASVINGAMAPFTRDLLGLPAVLGITLLFGILRKELALVLLFGALGTSQVSEVMSASQIYGFTLFVTFYIPCLATVAALAKELGWLRALAISSLTFGLAIGLAVAARFLIS